MELRVLEYFLALTREGSVSAAAEALHISQPTLSRQLIELERELGTTLFDRGRHGISLTEDGMILRRRAQEIVDLTRITENEIMLNHGAVAGEIRIGCAETQAMDLLARVMHELQAEHPQVTFRISSDLAENVVEQIEHGLVDFGLLLRLRDSWGLDAVRLPSAERTVVVAREDSPLAQLDVVTLDELAGQPLLLPSSYREGGLLGEERACEHGGRLMVNGYFDLSYNASRLVRSGLGSAVTLAGVISTPAGTGLVTRPVEIEYDMASYLVWKPFQLRTRACEELLERMRRTYGGAEE